jgi:hypothetical protein
VADPDWNAASTPTDTVAITLSDPRAGLPPNAALLAGARTFTVTLENVASPW